MRRTGLSRSTLYRMMDKGTFPRSYSVSDGRVGWSSQELEEWITARLQRGDDQSQI